MSKYGVATVDMHAPIIQQVTTAAALPATTRAPLTPHAIPTRHTSHATPTPSCNAPWQCGEPLQRQGCFGDPECWGPHCAPDGYAWLARTVIAPAIRRALQERTGARNARRTRLERAVDATQLLPSDSAGP